MEMRFFNNLTKKYILLFPLCILIGAVGINMLGPDKVWEWNLFDIDYLTNVSTADLKFTEVLYFLLKKRSLHIVLIVLVCFSTIRDRLLYYVVAWMGLTFGVILAALFLQYGFKGIWIFAIGILIHILIYIFATIMLLYISVKNDKNVLSGGYILPFILFLAGIMVESLLNWGVFPKILGLYH